ncbi:putative membrane protein [Devosia enhydra]|uniref:Putative membrane protein n=1 Tax=Devosia enhydra TaxID=665118 RepID=A0A1K2HTJ0_9HYPH|nr:TIGR01620 family protein [Devosia enhydra]SFZ81464.1 putative membrane protein [Devosia enhydra]
MKPPRAIPIAPETDEPLRTRPPRAIAVDRVALDPVAEPDPEILVDPALPPKKGGAIRKLFIGAIGMLVGLGIGLAADRLIRDLFATYPALGWIGLAVLMVALLAGTALLIREILAVRRLAEVAHLRRRATEILATDHRGDGQRLLAELDTIYAGRPDLDAANTALRSERDQLFDGAEMVRLAERRLLAPLDARARALTAASARRVAVVTTVSPRALVDIAFVVYESVRLGGAIARLYGARPGLIGSWRLAGAILQHLAVTGGLVLTDGVVEQLVGQGLAAKLSARLGEGVVNGLMTVRVGIAAMIVVRPLPFTVAPQPKVRDFLSELVNVMDRPETRS